MDQILENIPISSVHCHIPLKIKVILNIQHCHTLINNFPKLLRLKYKRCFQIQKIIHPIKNSIHQLMQKDITYFKCLNKFTKICQKIKEN